MTKKIKRFTIKNCPGEYSLLDGLSNNIIIDAINRLGELEDKETRLEPQSDLSNLHSHCHYCRISLNPIYRFCPFCKEKLVLKNCVK